VVENRATWLGEPISIRILLVADDLLVVDAETQETLIVEGLEGPTRPLFLGIMAGQNRYVGLFTALTSEMSHTGQWGQGISIAFACPDRPIPAPEPDLDQEPLPALANPTFMETAALKVGDVVHAEVNSAQIDLRIVGVVRHFPTIYEQAGAGCLVPPAICCSRAERHVTTVHQSNEVLIETDGRTSLDSLSSWCRRSRRAGRRECAQGAQGNPLALALRAATFFGAALMILLSLVGFAAHFYLSIRQQEMLYGVMRALGLSPRQFTAGSWSSKRSSSWLAWFWARSWGYCSTRSPYHGCRSPWRATAYSTLCATHRLAGARRALSLSGVALLAMLGVVTALLRRAGIDRICGSAGMMDLILRHLRTTGVEPAVLLCLTLASALLASLSGHNPPSRRGS